MGSGKFSSLLASFISYYSTLGTFIFFLLLEKMIVFERELVYYSSSSRSSARDQNFLIYQVTRLDVFVFLRPEDPCYSSHLAFLSF